MVACVLAGVLLSTSVGASVWPGAIVRVEQGLRSELLERRRRAAEELDDLPRSAVLRLLPLALQDSDGRVRSAAAGVAIRSRYEPARDAVLPWFGDREFAVRLAATRVLGAFPTTDRGVRALARSIADPEHRVRLAAVLALGHSDHPESTLALLGHLDDADTTVQQAVIDALGRKTDPRSVVPLIGKLQHPHTRIRVSVMRALGRFGGGQVGSALVLALRDDNAEVREAALRALGDMEYHDATEAVIGLVTGDPDLDVQVAALHALGSIGGSTAATALISMLDSPRTALRLEAAFVLRRAAPAIAEDLVRCLRGQPTPARSRGCALALGRSRSPAARQELIQAWRRAALEPETALQALGELRDRSALPAVLEGLQYERATVRLEAVKAVAALLDPDAPDGRAVEPIVAALEGALNRPEEQLALVELLGRTGSPRAGPHLVTLAGSPSARMRLAAVTALGQARAAAEQPVLLGALSDRVGAVRRAAALALRRAGTESLIPVLAERFERAAGQDRLALALALAGPLSRAREPRRVSPVSRLIAGAKGALRAALIDALAQAPGAVGSAPLLELLQDSDRSTRAKIAEALGAHPEAVAALRTLSADPNAQVRANAIWSLGGAGAASDLDFLESRFADRDVGVSVNAVASFGRIAQREQQINPEPLCQALNHARAYARSNALAALRELGAECSTGKVDQLATRLLERDPSPAVRSEAAKLLWSVPAAQHQQALHQCLLSDPSGMVAALCREPGASAMEVKRGVAPLTVLVVPFGAHSPEPGAPFTLVLPNGARRVGLADERGAVFEPLAPSGAVGLGPILSDEAR